MVMRLLLFALFLSLPLQAESIQESTHFNIEFSKPNFYEGEVVLCHFFLYSNESVLDVEVEKFPEFRGYWSENLALRQGPLGLLPDNFNSNLKRVLVGTYSIIPMVGKADLKIVPMRVVVKGLVGDAIGKELQFDSEPPPYTVKKLPRPHRLSPVPSRVPLEILRFPRTDPRFVSTKTNPP